jgi:hypothetical protein
MKEFNEWAADGHRRNVPVSGFFCSGGRASPARQLLYTSDR